MIQINKILYPTDFSKDARQALNHAIFLAEQFNAELHMLHVVTLHNDDPYNGIYHFESIEDISDRVVALADSKMANLLKAHEDDSLRVIQAQRREVSVVPAILEYAEAKDIDLIVMGTHGRRGISRMFQGSVAEETVRLANCPVMTLHGHPEETPVEAFKQILVPIDFSEYSWHALRCACALAQTYQSSIQLLHVIENPSVPDFYIPVVGSVATDSLHELEKIAMDSLSDMVTTCQRELGGYVSYTCHTAIGRATHEVLEFANYKGSDLILLSTHGLTGLQRLVFGSVAEQLTRRAKCPVFTAKAFGKSILKPS